MDVLVAGMGGGLSLLAYGRIHSHRLCPVLDQRQPARPYHRCWATPPVTSDPHREVAAPADHWEGVPLPSPPWPPDHGAVPATSTTGSSLSAGRSGRYLRSRPAKVLAGLFILIGVAALSAVVAIKLAAPAPTTGRSTSTPAAAPTASTPAAAAAPSASAPAAAAPTTAPVPDDQWLKGLDSLQTRMNDAFGPDSSVVTPASLRSAAKLLRRCAPELARLGLPSAQLRPVYQLASQGCAGYAQGATCFAAAAGAFADSGPAFREFTKLLDCGDAGANKGSELLSEAVADGFEFQPS